MNIVSSDLTSNNLTFKINSVDAIKVATNGYVGIGTTTPSAVLDVSGAVKFRGTLDLTSQKITNVASPTSTTDVATKSYVDIAMPIGGIIMWSGSTPPTNWGLCDGSTYGDVVSPDLRGRFVLSSGQGSGLTNRTLGQTGGAETVTLSNSQIPNHTHSLSSSNAPITSVSTVNNTSMQTTGKNFVYDNTWSVFINTPNTTTPPWFSVSTTSTISGRTNDISNYTTQSSVPIMSPYYALAFIIRYQ